MDFVAVFHAMDVATRYTVELLGELNCVEAAMFALDLAKLA